jgi:hypothetical protein
VDTIKASLEKIKPYTITVLKDVVVAAIVGSLAIGLRILNQLFPGILYIAVPLLVANVVAYIVLVQVYHKRKQPVERIYTNQGECLRDLCNSFRGARSKAKILVSRATSLCGTQPAPFVDLIAENQLISGLKVQMLFISPESRYLEERQQETGLEGKPMTEESPERYRQLVEASIGIMARLAANRPNLEVGLYDQKIIWRLFIFDDVLFLATYPPRSAGVHGGENACILKVRKETNAASCQLYLAFERLFDDLLAKFRANPELNAQLCRVCSSAELSTAQKLAERRRERGGCFGCKR